MSEYELFSVALSCLAAVISLVVWNGQRKLQREANELQRATAELANKQLEMLVREEQSKNKARLSLALEQNGKSHRFRITNVSNVEASNIELKLALPEPNDSPIIAAEYAEKFPVKVLHPGTSISLIAALHIGSPSVYHALVSWNNPDGSHESQQSMASL